MNKKMLILVRGIPGAGKTEFAEAMAYGNEFPVLSADNFFMQDGKYNFDKTRLGSAHLWCQNNTVIHMINGVQKIFVANTFTTEKEMQPYFDMAAKYDYMVFSIVVENRHGNINVHNVPNETIEAMKNRFNIKLL